MLVSIKHLTKQILDVAELKLKAMGIDIDNLSTKQTEYLEDWEEGT